MKRDFRVGLATRSRLAGSSQDRAAALGPPPQAPAKPPRPRLRATRRAGTRIAPHAGPAGGGLPARLRRGPGLPVRRVCAARAVAGPAESRPAARPARPSWYGAAAFRRCGSPRPTRKPRADAGRPPSRRRASRRRIPGRQAGCWRHPGPWSPALLRWRLWSCPLLFAERQQEPPWHSLLAARNKGWIGSRAGQHGLLTEQVAPAAAGQASQARAGGPTGESRISKCSLVILSRRLTVSGLLPRAGGTNLPSARLSAC